jgi:16S rRNA (uracil1498-N3)-methyltransferase
LRGSAAPGHLLLPALAADDRPEIPPDEAHYLTRVCRARAGDGFEATDGAGTVATLTLESVSPARAVVQTRRVVPRASRAWVLCGAPEGDRAEWLVEKLAELGIERWLPVDTTRAQWTSSQARPERWRRLATAALRQSRGAYTLAIDSPRPLAAALAELPPGGARWLASQEGEAAGFQPATDPEIALVGPAPGLTPEEVAAAETLGFEPVRLASARLRTETAALAWGYWWAARTLGGGGGGS